MTAVIKIKVSRKPVLKGRMNVRFPARVETDEFLTVDRANGVYTFSVDYSSLTPGPVSDPSTAMIAIEDQTSGIYRTVSLASLLTSGLDADLQAIAALTSTGVLVRTADDTWSFRTITGTANEITVTDGDGVSGNPTVSLPSALTFTGKTVTGGTYTGVVSINGNTWTAGTGTLTLGAGKTATISNTLTFTGTDGSSIAFGAGGTVAYTSNKLSAFAATTSAELKTVISDETGSGALVFATSPSLTTPSFAQIINTGTLTLPTSTDTLVGRATTDTLTNKTISGASNTLTVREADLSTSDVTTANVSTTKHGFAPKLPNDATKYLDGTGAYSVPAGSGTGDAISIFFGTVADAEAATIPSVVERIETSGYTTEGDGGGSIATNATYERVGTEPSHEGKIQSADGAWWELTGRRVSVMQFGAVPVVSDLDTDPDAAAAINDCMAYCNAKANVNMTIPAGTWPLDSALTSPTFIIEINGEQGGAQPTILYKRYTEADTLKGILSLGAWGGTVTDIQFAAKSGVSGGSSFSAILPNNAPNIGILRLRNVYSSCGDGVNSNLNIIGTNNTGGVGGTGGKSYRSVFLENCHFFGAAQYCVNLLSVQHCFASNIFMDTTGGTISSGIVFNCAGISSAPNDDIYWNGIIGGALNLDYTTRSVFDSVVTGNIDNTANVSDVTVTECKDTIGTSWVTSRVIHEYNAWRTSTPTPSSSGGGAFGSASASVAYKIKGKDVLCRGKITINTVGTASGSIQIQLPFTLKDSITLGGKENNVNGLAFVGSVGTTGVLGILKADNTSHIAANAVFPFQFIAELA